MSGRLKTLDQLLSDLDAIYGKVLRSIMTNRRLYREDIVAQIDNHRIALYKIMSDNQQLPEHDKQQPQVEQPEEQVEYVYVSHPQTGMPEKVPVGSEEAENWPPVPRQYWPE